MIWLTCLPSYADRLSVLAVGIIFLLILPFTQVLSVNAASPDANGKSLSVMNQSSYTDESRILHVYADIRNDLRAPQKNIIVTADFYDRNGIQIGASNASAALGQLDQGQYSPVEVQYLNSTNVSRVANYTLSVSSDKANSSLLTGLKILSANSRLDLLGTFYINLVVQNQANITATNVLAVATLYDKDSRVVAIGKALAESVPGSSDIPAGSTGAFGIAVTDKLQTYKVVRYTMEIQSDQLKSNPVQLDVKSNVYEANPPPSNTVSRCLIVTAAFGSDLAPQVQTLREFRDGVALRTFAGSNFMHVFNGWYYSFSPQIAEYERSAPWLQQAVRLTIQPLILILDVSSGVDSGLTGAVSAEFAIIVAGIVASILIGAIYLTPLACAVSLATRKKFNQRLRPAAFLVVFAFIAGTAAISISLLFTSELLAMLGASTMVVCAMTSTCFGVFWLLRR